MKKIGAIILSLLVTLLIASDLFLFNILKSPDSSASEQVVLSRVIDGDTIKLEDGRTVRLLNINAPEKGTSNALLSANFLKQFENKTLSLEVSGIDKYFRTLARVYSPANQYLNLELVKQGFSSKFLVTDRELSLFSTAEKEAILSSRGIWNRSDYFGCFKISIDSNRELVKLKNACNKLSLASWYLKDESRKVYFFKNISSGEVILHSSTGKDNETDVFWNSPQDIWNNDRDSLYLFDSKSQLAGYQTYGY